MCYNLIKNSGREVGNIKTLLIVLVTLAFIPTLTSLFMAGVISAESMAIIILLIIFLLVIARKFMQFIMPVTAIIIFLWVSSGSNVGAFSVLLSQIMTLGIMLLWFAWMFRILFRR
jgi:hypothetical protein